MSFPGAKLDQVAVKLEHDCTVTDDEAQLAAPGLQQAAQRRRLQEVKGNLK